MPTIGSVEFLEPAAADPSARNVGDADRSRASRRVGLPPRAAAALAVPLLGGAAGLATAAPFRSVYIATTRGTSGQDGSFQVDGWGRYGSPGRNLEFFGHADRYGILLLAAAVVLVLAALASAVVALRARPAAWPAATLGAVRAVALVGAGVLGALAGVGRMRATTEYDALISAISPGPFGARPTITVVSGGFVPMTVAAAAAALLGALVTLLGRSGPHRTTTDHDDRNDRAELPAHLPSDAAATPDGEHWMGEEELLGG